MTLDEMINAVEIQVSDGLKGVSLSYPASKIEKDIANYYSVLLKQYSAQGVIKPEEVSQRIDCLDLDCKDLHKCCIETHPGATSGTNALHFTIPRLAFLTGLEPISYLGTIDRIQPFKIYYDNSHIYNKYKKHTSKRPYIWIDLSINAEGKHDGYLFNNKRLKALSITAVFSDPQQAYEYSCCTSQEEFPAPQFMQDEIINKITARYVYYHRQLENPQMPADNVIRN